MAASNRVVFLSGPEDDYSLGDALMKFRLTYDGPLKASQRDPMEGQRNPLALHKHNIRRHFHQQMKILWKTNAFLRQCRFDAVALEHFGPHLVKPVLHDYVNRGETAMLDYVKAQYGRLGYQFVPLVCEQWNLLCSLEIMFLRRDIPGSVISAGDIDNRIKTLIDALRIPRYQNEIPTERSTPSADEIPFFCLLEDDKQVSHLSVETDTLLDNSTDAAAAYIMITVELRPYFINNFNLGFA